MRWDSRGISYVVCNFLTGLQLAAASRTYARLRQLRGKVHFTRTLAELKADRRSRLIRALGDRQVVMVPMVLTELLSDPKLPSEVAEPSQKYL
jgi:hypothetical protein